MNVRILGTALLLFPSACAADQRARPPAAHDSMLERAPAMSDDEVVDYIADLAFERLREVCGDRAMMSSDMTCVRDALLRGFDTTGEAKRHCRSDDTFGTVMRCVVMGSIGYDFARAAQIPVEDYNWDDPKAELKETVSTASRSHLQECLQSSIPEVDSCMAGKLGGTLSLSDRQVSACKDSTSLEKTVHCLSRTFLVRTFESAIGRMAPNGVGV